MLLPVPHYSVALTVVVQVVQGHQDRATVVVDVDGDGIPDYVVSGADRDGDGIPDALQVATTWHAHPYSILSPPALGVAPLLPLPDTWPARPSPQ